MKTKSQKVVIDKISSDELNQLKGGTSNRIKTVTITAKRK